MSVRRIVPNIYDADPARARAFYGELLGLDTAMDMGWVSTLVSPDVRPAQLTVMTQDAEPGCQPYISVEVDDVDAVHARAVAAGHEVVYSLRDEEWGVRRFMLRDHSGRVVNVLSHPARA